MVGTRVSFEMVRITWNVVPPTVLCDLDRDFLVRNGHFR